MLKVVFTKKHLIKVPKKNLNSTELVFSYIGLKVLKSCYLKSNELNLIKTFLKKRYKKKIIINFRIFSFLSLTAKPKGVRMGKGKGEIESWVAPIKQGQILLEISSSFDDKLIIESLLKLQQKLSVKTKIINLKNI